MRTKSHKQDDLHVSPRFKKNNQHENLQLESLYSREAYVRARGWKRYQDKISQDRLNWPLPMNGLTYNKREKAIYNVNTNNYNNDNSWFNQNIYKNILLKPTQIRHIMLNVDKSALSKETKLEQEVRKLRYKLKDLELYELNDIYLKPMYSVLPSICNCLYNGVSQELEGRFDYLNKRKLYAPNEKYSTPLCSSWDITWDIKDCSIK